MNIKKGGNVTQTLFDQVLEGKLDHSKLGYSDLKTCYYSLIDKYPEEDFPLEEDLIENMTDWFDGFDPEGFPWSVRSAMIYMIDKALNGEYEDE